MNQNQSHQCNFDSNFNATLMFSNVNTIFFHWTIYETWPKITNSLLATGPIFHFPDQPQNNCPLKVIVLFVRSVASTIHKYVYNRKLYMHLWISHFKFLNNYKILFVYQFFLETCLWKQKNVIITSTPAQSLNHDQINNTFGKVVTK